MTGVKPCNTPVSLSTPLTALDAPTDQHLIAAKRVLRYIKGTLDYGVLFSKGLLTLHGFSDADWVNFIDTRRSTRGLCLFFGPNPISWSSKRQGSVSRSSTEAEYRSLANTTVEIYWVTYLSTWDQIADVFTKGMAGPRFSHHIDKLKVISGNTLHLEEGDNNTLLLTA
ncbi:uncharacterized protein LOC113348244 [Papaver somniferum]|uniref:uncharacterized protein LOC113348244 n=1 Tax=Papaver somniferum TaxID=3469 RepID=UPI000E6F625C|nr:uncharacterized protein LOC113348244 [Papaver somniferum]